MAAPATPRSLITARVVITLTNYERARAQIGAHEIVALISYGNRSQTIKFQLRTSKTTHDRRTPLIVNKLIFHMAAICIYIHYGSQLSLGFVLVLTLVVAHPARF